MKRIISCILILLILVPTMVVSASTTTIEDELLEQMFDYFGGDEMDLSYYPPELPYIIIYDYVEVNDIVIFSAIATWRGTDLAEVVERYDEWVVYSTGTNYPSYTSMFVRKDGEIYTLTEAWESGIVNDLSPAVGFYRPEVYQIGDADLDYEVSVLDATLIQMEIAKTAPLGKQTIFEVNDVDNDGKVTILDATAIQMKLAKLL